MIDAIEPLSLVLWGVFFLAAGMYPLGFMLGASCSPCCGGQCGDPPVEFNRCIRFVNTNTSAPQTTYAAGASVDMPLHGYSRAVTRPEQVGAVRVATKLEVSGGVWISQLARGMSIGEVRTGIYRIYYKSPTGVDVGTAARWAITVRGVAITGDGAAPTPIVFGEDANGKTVTIYSDNAPVQDPAYYGKLIPFPTVELSPSGEQLRSTLILQAEQIQDVFQAFANDNLYGIVSPKTTKSGWIMRAFDPGVGATFNGFGHPAENQWNYDTEAVLAFLSGDSTMPYNSGSASDPTQIQYGPPPSTTWTMQVSDPTQFCGATLCGSNVFPNGLRPSVGYPNTLSKTLTYTPTVKLPSTYSISTDGAGSPNVYTNLCYGQDTLQPMSLRLGGCSYSGDKKTCQSLFASHAGNYGAEQRLIKGSAVRYFYCGDLLWVIENGPCRQSLTYTGSEAEWYNCGTYELDGDDDSLWAGDWMCFDVNGKHRRTPKFPSGKCPPLELEVEVTNNITLGNGYGEFSDAWRHTGTVSPGTYVLLLDNESETSGFSAPYGDCNYQAYSLLITSESGWTPVTVGAAWIRVRRVRDTWCSSWKVWRFNAIQGAGFVNVLIVFNPWRAKSSGGNEGYEPALGTDFDVTSYEEIDPVPTSVSPKNSQVPKAGGTVTLQRCCPQRTETVTVPPYTGRFAREILLEASQDYTSPTVIQVTQGATAYVTQAGYDGVECPFDVIWLSGSTGYATFYLASEFPGRIFSSDSCPIVGQVSPSEQPEYEWSVTANENWIVVGKTDDGLLTISIDNNVTPVFAQPIYYNFTERQARRANITITSSGTTRSWTIIQLKP